MTLNIDASLQDISAAFKQGELKSSALTQQMLVRIADNDQQRVVFTDVFEGDAMAAALESDKRWASGAALSPIDGIPVSVKDLFDVEGRKTLAGSKVLANLSDIRKAKVDAVVIERLKAAGAVIIGRTNMTEFAYSGLGINPHNGTPLSPWNRAQQHVAGGSSCGAAVSVTDGMASAGIGTDTGGSVRIPAAFCGLTGFKPTAMRIDQTGAFPLSTSLDSIGPMAHRVNCCQWLDSVMAGDRITIMPSAEEAALAKVSASSPPVLGMPSQLITDQMDDVVAATFASACEALRRAGFRILDVDLPELEELSTINANGGLIAAESWHWHEQWLSEGENSYDPRVAVRIRRGQKIDAQAYKQLLHQRTDWIARVRPKIASFDALVMPTVPVVPPKLQPLLESDEQYTVTNLLVLRNPSVVNFLDGCALTLPCHQDKAAAPVGLMLASLANRDAALLRLGRVCESVLSNR